MVDSHCHLDVAAAVRDSSPAEAISGPPRSGVTRIVQIGCDLDELALGRRGRRRAGRVVVAGVAIHPNDAARMRPDARSTALAEIEAAGPASASPGGGGDRPGLLPDPGRGRARRQQESFAAHIALAKPLRQDAGHPRPGRPRRRSSTCWTPRARRTGSSCTASPATPTFARECLNRGAYLSFAGTVTFKATTHSAGRARRDAARPDPGRDRRALPDPDAAPRPAQRVLPDPAHGPVHGRRARHRPRPRLPRPGRQCRRRVRRRWWCPWSSSEVLRRRRMVRAYDPTRPVPAADRGRRPGRRLRAPSAGFTQGCSFLVLTGEDRAAYWAATADRRKSGWLAGCGRAAADPASGPAEEAYLDRYAEPDKGWTDRDPCSLVGAVLVRRRRDGGDGRAADAPSTRAWVPASSASHGRGSAASGRRFGVPDDQLSVGVISLGYAGADRASEPVAHPPARRLAGRLLHRGHWRSRVGHVSRDTVMVS